MSSQKLNLFSFSGNIKILHMTWMAFFISFVVWFNHAPLMLAIAKTLNLSQPEIKTILILNVALTIPARIVIGILVDKFGPKRTYSTLLALGSIPCFMFATADSFQQLALARFLMGFIGAGFVIALALVFGGDEGWRYSIGCTGVIALLYSVIYYFSVTDTPKGSTYFKPKKAGAMEVTSIWDLFFYIAMNIPLYATLSLLTWKLSSSGGANYTNLLSDTAAIFIHIGIWCLFVYNVYKIIHVNEEHLQKPVAEIHKYKFKQVAVLDLAYMIAFGSELAVVSMLPLFFYETFHESQNITMVEAGLLGGSFAFINLIARPAGGWLSDKFGRKLSLSVFIAGMSAGYCIMSFIDSAWSIPVVVLLTMSCSCFVSGGCGAVYAIVPLIKRRMTGQIAGMVGAYGNVGGVLFLTILSFVTPNIFFLVMHGVALAVLVAVQFIDEPKGHMAEVQEDGSVEMIELS
jgi:MFS transporter, NNP family, nitrate/nitrite transporter